MASSFIGSPVKAPSGLIAYSRFHFPSVFSWIPYSFATLSRLLELVTKARTNEKVVRESGGEQLLKGYRGEIAQRLMNTASVVEQQVFRNRI